MRLCYFTPNFLPAIGGAEVVTDALSRQWAASGHDVTVLARGPAVTLDVPYRVEHYKRPMMHRYFPERIGSALKKLHAQKQFDLIIANYGSPTGYAAIKMGHRTKTPVVVVSHGGDLHPNSKDRHRPHLWKRTVWAYQHADALVAISPYIEMRIREINPNPRRLQRIPNGVDAAELSRAATAPEDFDQTRPFALCMGNLRPEKGFDDAINAFAKALPQLGDLQLVMVGDGKLRDALRQEAHNANVADRVHFLGSRTGNDKRWLMQSCAFGLMPSIQEGHPIVGLEFLALGKPVICSTHAAFDGMYDDGVNALRVAPADRDALSQAIQKMHQCDAQAIAQMGAVSRERAKAYAWSHVAGKYLKLFTSLVANPHVAEPNVQAALRDDELPTTAEHAVVPSTAVSSNKPAG